MRERALLLSGDSLGLSWGAQYVIQVNAPVDKAANDIEKKHRGVPVRAGAGY